MRTFGDMRSLDVLIERWKEQGITPSPPYSASKVREAFATAGAVATQDVIETYTRIGGAFDGDVVWELWSLDDILKRNEERSPFGVMFSDYLIDCWGYRLLPSSQATSAVYVDYFDRAQPAMIAESMEEFFASYAEDPHSLLNAGSIDDVRRNRRL
jgi:hypothetical protein